MPNRRSRFCLAQETQTAIFGSEVFGVQYFQRDLAAEALVPREVDAAHSSLAEDANDVESVEGLREVWHEAARILHEQDNLPVWAKT